jgi:catechol 2,3-dioxygenase-like lactoylglutathione lyase family enzyme
LTGAARAGKIRALNPTETIRYAHTNLIAKDWRRLANFYEKIFGCVPVSSERDHHGPKFEALTARAKARARGRHLRLPGHGENGPTLEIFEYEAGEGLLKPEIARAGFAHIAFEVPDVAAKRDEILREGGRDYGQVVTLDIAGAGKLTLCYMCDPEGNIIELQRWHGETQ